MLASAVGAGDCVALAIVPQARTTAAKETSIPMAREDPGMVTSAFILRPAMRSARANPPYRRMKSGWPELEQFECRSIQNLCSKLDRPTVVHIVGWVVDEFRG